MFGEGAEEVVEGIWHEICYEKLSDYVFEALNEKKWKLHDIEEDACIVYEHLPQYREYIERLGRIVVILKAAAEKLVEEAEKEGKGSVKIKVRPYIAYEGPVELSARVEHVTRDGRKYAVIEAKYGEKTAKVELDIEKYRRSALLHNLAAIATDDRRNFYGGRVSHITASYLQAAERLAMWALFMPSEYKITVRHVRVTEEGLSPRIEIWSRLGRSGLAKIENSPIHSLVLRLARGLAGGKKLSVDKVLAASWLMISAILNTPDGKKPSEGLAFLVEKGALPRAALNRLRPIFEELDALLDAVSREDKAYLVGKMVDYDGYIKEGLLLVSAKKTKKIPIELDGVEIRMADVALAAAKAFSEKGGWSGDYLSFGPASEVPLKIVDVPAFKAMAALISQERRDKTDELRRKDLVEYVELYRREINGGEIKILAAKAKEESVQIAQLEAIWKEFKIGKYTHLRLVIGGEEYDLFYSYGRFAIKGEEAQKLKKALEELGLNAEVTSSEYLCFHGEEVQKLAKALEKLNMNVPSYFNYICFHSKKVQELKKAMKELGLNVEVTSSGYFRHEYLYLRYEHLEALLDKGVKAYAVRKAKKKEAQWRFEMTYKGVTMVLEMTYDEHKNRLEKYSESGKIEAIVYEEGASKIKSVELDLNLLVAAGGNCEGCPEKRLAEAFAAASEKGFSWSVTSDRKHLHVYLPSDFRDVVRRFYSE